MNMTEGLRFVHIRAAGCSKLYNDRLIRVEHLYLGILKFAQVDLNQQFMLPGEKRAMAQEQAALRQVLKDHNTDPGAAEDILKGRLLEAEYRSKLVDGSKCFNDAVEAAKARGEENVSSIDLVQQIHCTETPALKGLYKLDPAPKQEQAPKKDAAPKQEAPKQDVPKDIFDMLAMNVDKFGKNGDQRIGVDHQSGDDEAVGPQEAENPSLPKLMTDVQIMTQKLLSTVRGQDHAVKSFVDGHFNAELLAKAEKGRKRPRAIFLFAGPPGVGKTFLAEQAAEALNIPFKRFDMSGYSSNLGVEQLAGMEKSYKAAKPGQLTGFVKENPRCFLLFDEIEKAHIDVIHLFLQILDAGRMHDQFHDEDVSFADTTIILTTNAGHNLYEGKEGTNLSGISKRTILNAMETDINPKTNEPFFPAAICSRLATGTVLMFNYLQSHDLESIARGELDRTRKNFTSQYGIEVDYDEKIPALMLYKEGGIVDARTLRAQTELFFKNEIMKCLQLYKVEKMEELSKEVKKISFSAEEWASLEALDPIFKASEKGAVLLFGNDGLGSSMKKHLPEYDWFVTSEEDQAFEWLAEHEIHLILTDLANKEALNQQKQEGTMFNFDYIPASASVFSAVRGFVGRVHERMPEIPVFVLERDNFAIDSNLEMGLIQAGVRGKLDVKDSMASTYRDRINSCLQQMYLQRIATAMSANHRIITFETSPQFEVESKTLRVRCRNYAMHRLVDVNDADTLLSEAERPNIRFDDVIGAGAAKEEMKFFIEYLKNPRKFVAKGKKPPKGILLYGPPGTGKTMLAKAMAGESGINFLSETASNFVGQYTGTGPAAVRNLFAKARKYAPAVVFIDEIDAIGRTRTGGTSAHAEETTLNTLLTEMDGFKVDLKRPVFIIAATNFKVQEGVGGPGYIDPALVRRFDRKILIDLPDKAERRQLLKLLCDKVEGSQVTDKMLDRLAGRTLGKSPAVITNIISQADRLAQRKGSPLTDDILMEAFETAVHGEKKDWGYETMERVAWHEAGHAFLYWKNGNVPAYLTIVARGDHGGYMEHSDEEYAAPIKSRAELLENIRVSLAGRAAEIVRFGPEDGVSTGASGDLQSATRNARNMLCTYGMDDELGMVYIDKETASNGEMAMLIHRKVSGILKEQLAQTVALLTAERPRMERLVNLLLEKNSLTGEEIDAVLKQDN